MGLIDLERNSTDERVSVIARLRALGVDLSKELLHAAQVAESVATLELAEPRAAFNEVRFALFHARLAQSL
jgi:hypothetical protein